MIMDLQLSEVFHITPLIKLFEILHQFEVVIENSDLKVGWYKEERKIGFIPDSLSFHQAKHPGALQGQQGLTSQLQCNVATSWRPPAKVQGDTHIQKHLNHLTTGSAPMPVKDAEEITSTHRQCRSIAVLDWVVGLQGVCVKELDWSSWQVGAGVLIVSKHRGDL